MTASKELTVLVLFIVLLQIFPEIVAFGAENAVNDDLQNPRSEEKRIAIQSSSDKRETINRNKIKQVYALLQAGKDVMAVLKDVKSLTGDQIERSTDNKRMLKRQAPNLENATQAVYDNLPTAVQSLYNETIEILRANENNISNILQEMSSSFPSAAQTLLQPFIDDPADPLKGIISLFDDSFVEGIEADPNKFIGLLGGALAFALSPELVESLENAKGNSEDFVNALSTTVNDLATPTQAGIDKWVEVLADPIGTGFGGLLNASLAEDVQQIMDNPENLDAAIGILSESTVTGLKDVAGGLSCISESLEKKLEPESNSPPKKGKKTQNKSKSSKSKRSKSKSSKSKKKY